MKLIVLILSLFAASCGVHRPAPASYGIVGTYTSGNSHGIFLFKFNPSNGSIQMLDSAEAINPSYLTLSTDRKYLYSVYETGGAGGGWVASYAFHGSDSLQSLSMQPSGGDHPCYITTDREGRWLFTGNYSSGTVSLYPIQDGAIGAPAQVIQHNGRSVHKRQESPHVHATVLSPDNKTLFVPDLGIDAVMVYRFENGKLTEGPPVKVRPGSGPRHLRFHPNGKWAYLVNELSGTVIFYTYNEGYLLQQQEISTLPAGYTGRFTSADIRIHPSGKFLYASNRDDLNALAIFSIDDAGRLTLKGQQPVPGKTPRNFNFDPTGKFLLVAHQNGGGIAVFRVNTKDGSLQDTGHRLSVERPVCIDWR